MFWPYLGFALATAGWLLSCLSIGHAALRLLAIRLPFRERLLFDVTVGVLLFAIGLFVAGLFRLLRPPFFFVYPALLLAVGARWTFADLRRAWRHLRAARRRSHVPPSSFVILGALLFGALGLAIVYLSILTPDNVAFDSRTYHLPIAEHFAAWGRIGKFPEGWYAGVLPHLASWLYTWPFTLRSVNLFGQVEMAAHMELALFVVTVFSIPLLVRALCPGRRVRGSWAVFFLFPGLYLYDSSLGAAADHVLAFWAVPLALALRRMAQRPSPATGALVGAIMAGAAMTKYQAVYVLVPAALFVSFIAGRELWRTRRDPTRAGAVGLRRAILAPPAALALVALVASAPHWLANLVWHGNPVYPMLLHVFPSHPLVPGWVSPTVSSATFDPGWQPTRPAVLAAGRDARRNVHDRLRRPRFRDVSPGCSGVRFPVHAHLAVAVAGARRSSRAGARGWHAARGLHLVLDVPRGSVSAGDPPLDGGNDRRGARAGVASGEGRARGRRAAGGGAGRVGGRRPLAPRQRDDA